MKVFITRLIPDKGINMLKEKGYELVISPHDRVLTKEELLNYLKSDKFDAMLCQLEDKITPEVLDAAKESGIKIIANYAVGYDNIDVRAAAERGIMVTNTPGVLTDTVAEHTFALMLSIAHRIAEADRFTRAGKFKEWAPMLLLGTDLSRKTLGIVGLGRIGSRVAYHAVRGFDMRVIYYDVKRNEEFEKEFSGFFPAGGEGLKEEYMPLPYSPSPVREWTKGGGGGAVEYRSSVEDVLREADFVSIHVPLLPTTRHLINAERLKMMKPTAYLVNTSRGAVIDEKALVDALRNGTIRGAAIDVYENEPALTPGLTELENIVLTPHIASATEETRQAMGEVDARNIIEALEGRIPPNLVKP